MKVINFLGAPGAGKSTMAAELFVAMKKSGYNVELVTEYAKDMVWEERELILDDQVYIFAKQNRKLQRLIGKVDFAITDSPLLLSAFYLKKPDPTFTKLVVERFLSYNNHILWVPLLSRERYSEVGRLQTYEQSRQLEEALQNFMLNNVPRSGLETSSTVFPTTPMESVFTRLKISRAA